MVAPTDVKEILEVGTTKAVTTATRAAGLKLLLATAAGTQDEVGDLDEFLTQYSEVADKGAMLAQTLGLSIGYQTKAATNLNTYTFKGGDQTSAANWIWTSQVEAMTEAVWAAVTEPEIGQKVQTYDGDKKAYQYYINPPDVSPGWHEIVGSVGPAGAVDLVEDVLTWTVVGAVATVVITEIPAVLKTVRLYMDSTTVLRPGQTNMPVGTYDAPTRKFTVDGGDFSINDGDEVLIVYRKA